MVGHILQPAYSKHFNPKLKDEEILPAALAAGCDMILFNKDIREDYQFVRDALKDGRLTMERVDEAVTLVKDTQNLLPISPDKYKKIRLYLLENRIGGGCPVGREVDRIHPDEAGRII